tara:strand:- start:57 stop:347 length:291 start_codon:yes stop_codon:yes gene_type:complete
MPSSGKDKDLKELHSRVKEDRVGPFGRADAMVENFAVGWLYQQAMEELLRQEKEIRIQLETMDDEEREMLLPILEEELEEIERKWRMAVDIFSIEA